MKQFFFLLTWLSVPVMIFGQPGNGTVDAFRAERLFSQAQGLFESDQFARSIEVLNEVANLNPEHPQVYLYRAESYYALRNFESALDDYARAIEQNPQDPELYNSRGAAAANLGLYKSAASYFYEALKLDPDHEGANQNLADVNRIIKGQEDIAYADNRTDYSRTNSRDRDYESPRHQTKKFDDLYENRYKDPVRPNPSRNDKYNNSNRNNHNKTTRPNPSNKNNSRTDKNTRPYDEQERSANKEYKFGKNKIVVGSQTDGFVQISQIHITEKSTHVTMVVQSAGTESFHIKLDRRGSPNAFYLVDQGMKNSYLLKNVRGLPGWKSGTAYELQPGKQKLIVLEFDRLDDDVRIFHMLEGKVSRETSWDFYDIELKE